MNERAGDVGLFAEPIWIIVVALAFDAIIGDPDLLWRRLPHPVSAFGRLISGLDRRLNHDAQSFSQRRLAGALAVGLLVFAAGFTGWVIAEVLHHLPGNDILIALFASIFFAQRSLYDHVSRVRVALETGGLAAGRRAVALIVGRDPESLDEAGVCRAAIESCAENFSDGIVAPAFWFAVFGLPGLLAYKAVNTADSMLGHRSERYAAFGWAAARLDDVVNFIPARLSGLLLSLAAFAGGGGTKTSFSVMWRDAGKHRSPNAGWPESAMAGALGVALAGPRRYDQKVVDDPFLNAKGSPVAMTADIGRSLRLLTVASVLHAAIYAALALVF